MLHVLRLPLPNVYLLVGAKAILIDAGRPRDSGAILSFVQRRIDLKKLSLILLTHGHWDHAGAAAKLQRRTKVPIALHRADAGMAARGDNGPLRPTHMFAHMILPFVNPTYPPFEPDLLIDQEMDLADFGVNGRVLFTPGHTPGSISVITGDNEAIVGDLLMGGIWGGWVLPRRPGFHYFAEDFPQVRASIRKVLALSPRVIYGGHGGPLNPRDAARLCGYKPQAARTQTL